MVIYLRHCSSIVATSEVLTSTMFLLLSIRKSTIQAEYCSVTQASKLPTHTLLQSSPSCRTLCGILPAQFGGGREGHKVLTEIGTIHTEFFKTRPTNCRPDGQT